MFKTLMFAALVMTACAAPAMAQFDSECRPLPPRGYIMLPQPPSPSCLQARAVAQEALQAREQAQQDAYLQAKRTMDNKRIAAEKAQRVAEESPDNVCRTKDTARMLIEEYNGLSWGYYQRKAVDIEHLVTISKTENGLVCHGVFVHTNGARIAGTLSFKPNVAGDVMISWEQG